MNKEEIIRGITGTVERVSSSMNSQHASELEYRRAPGKWSKKEILGHLIDSGINNLQRFTEIQHAELPFRYENYRQDDLVIANDYQNSDLTELLSFWKAINARVCSVIELQNQQTLQKKIIAPNGDQFNLQFLIEDYLDHLNHHGNQIS